MVDKGTLFATPMISCEESKQWGIVEGKMVSIRCAHTCRDIELYPLAEVNMEVEVHCIYCVW